MDNENIKILSATVNPANAGANGNAEFKKKVEQASNVAQDVMNGFSDEVPTGDDATEEQYKKASGFLDRFLSYIQSQSFSDSVNNASKKYNVPPKKIAEGFFGQILGAIGDVAGIAVATVGNGAHTVIDVLSTLAHGAVDVVIGVVNAIVSVFTLNKTCNTCTA